MRTHNYFILAFIIFFLPIISIAQDLPVTNKKFNDSETNFRFAIVSDRTGGMQPGIFKIGIDKVGLMQPEFVLSVGDLIDGYTEDPKVWNAQWNEFDAIVADLDMPFYHVPGNHDTSNKLLTEAWRARLGRDYYHFTYKDVLFVAINTDEIEGGGIGPEQVAYFEKILKENKDVKWTLLFMHRPLWSYEDRLGYDGIEKALGDRPYTLFSGHHHHYRYKTHNGMEHFTLATTGGGSDLRGSQVGEFHHITWVTMKDEGPKVAHLELSGIYDKNVVAEADYEDIQVLRKGEWLKVAPYIHPTDSFEKLTANLLVENNSKRPLHIKGTFDNRPEFSFAPETIKETLLPNTKREIAITIASKKGDIPVVFLNENPIEFELQAGITSIIGDSISLKTTKKLDVDWIHQLVARTDKIKVDGNLDDWSSQDFIAVNEPQFFQEGWDWKGLEDGAFSFATTKDDKNLYIAVKFTDELKILEKDISARQDKFYIHLGSEAKSIEIALAAGPTPEKPRMEWLKGNSRSITAAITEKDTDQFLEMALPLKALYNPRNEPKSIRINIGIMDHDRPENTKPSVLWWRPLWGTDGDYLESGIFELK